MTKHEVKDWIERTKIMPAIKAESTDQAMQGCELLLNSGIDVLEVTLTVPGALDVIRKLSQEFRNRVLIGAGNITTPNEANACIDAGARFIVSPNTNPNIVSLASQSGIFCAPGALTPSEVLHAHNLGSDIVKVFPCEYIGGSSYISTLKTTYSQIPLMPTGNITLEEITSYIQAGAVAIGLGSNVFDLQLLSSNPDDLINRAKAFLAAAKGSQ